MQPITSTLNIATLVPKVGIRMAGFGLISLMLSIASWHPQQAHGWLVLSGLIPVLWARANNRAEATFAVAPYFLYATRDVPEILQSFTQAVATWCFLITLLYCAVITMLWVVAWQRSFAKRVIGLTAVAVFTLVPPFGSLFVANPMLATGLMFPGTGPLGMLVMFATWIAIDAWQQRSVRPRILLLASVCLATLSFATQLMQAPDADSFRIVPINTQMSKYPVPSDVEGRYTRQLDLIELVQQSSKAYPNNTVFVLPESIAGRQEARFKWLWADTEASLNSRSQSLILGVETVNAQGLANSAVMIGKHAGQASANTPVPVGSWQPWKSELHYPARLLSADTLQIDTTGMQVFFCWEELVPWPWLVASLRTPHTETAIVLVNHWFGAGTDANDAQARSSKAWARLFGLRIVRSVNLSTQ